eukprot:9155357-Alexandrium_andersonii.AAC.1
MPWVWGLGGVLRYFSHLFVVPLREASATNDLDLWQDDRPMTSQLCARHARKPFASPWPHTSDRGHESAWSSRARPRPDAGSADAAQAGLKKPAGRKLYLCRGASNHQSDVFFRVEA